MAATAPAAGWLGGRTIDLRGAAVASAARGATVLADPTGQRARRMRLAGRLVALAFAVWLCALTLAGLNLLPSGSVPSGPIDAGAGPQSRSHVEAIGARVGTLAAHVPARASRAAPPVAGTRAGARTTRPAAGQAPSGTLKRTTARERPVSRIVPPPTVTAPATTPHAPNPPAARPGATATPKPSHGKSATAPGHTRTPREPATSGPAATRTPKSTQAPTTHAHAGANPSREN